MTYRVKVPNGPIWREPLAEGKGASGNRGSERSLKQKLLPTNRNCI